jgi:hypothetical protein
VSIERQLVGVVRQVDGSPSRVILFLISYNFMVQLVYLIS